MKPGDTATRIILVVVVVAVVISLVLGAVAIPN